MTPGLLLAAVLSQAGLCGPVTPDATPDPVAADIYKEVAEAEQAAGNRETALVAWREVLRRAPEDERARAALQALCRERSRDGGGSQAEEEGDAEGALLEGLSLFERGEDTAAAEAFHEALAAPELADTASFFLGLLALRDGRGREAGAFFEAAAASPDEGLARRAEALRLRAEREGRLALSVRVGGEYDSNVDLAPDGLRGLTGGSDGVGLAFAELRVRPWGQRGPYARVSGHHRGHLRFRSFDLAGAGGVLGWAHEGPALRLSAEYGLDSLALAGTPYLLTHQLRVDARAPLGPLVLEASGAVRREDFRDVAFAGYSGWRSTARLDAEWSPGESVTLTVGWLGGRARTSDVALGFLEHGPRAGLHLGLAPGLRLVGELGYTLRGYSDFDSPLGTRRADGYLDAGAAVECDVAPHWSLQASVGWRAASSNVPELSHGRLVGGVGLVWARGL